MPVFATIGCNRCGHAVGSHTKPAFRCEKCACEGLPVHQVQGTGGTNPLWCACGHRLLAHPLGKNGEGFCVDGCPCKKFEQVEWGKADLGGLCACGHRELRHPRGQGCTGCVMAGKSIAECCKSYTTIVNRACANCGAIGGMHSVENGKRYKDGEVLCEGFSLTTTSKVIVVAGTPIAAAKPAPTLPQKDGLKPHYKPPCKCGHQFVMHNGERDCILAECPCMKYDMGSYTCECGHTLGGHTFTVQGTYGKCTQTNWSAAEVKAVVCDCQHFVCETQKKKLINIKVCQCGHDEESHKSSYCSGIACQCSTKKFRLKLDLTTDDTQEVPVLKEPPPREAALVIVSNTSRTPSTRAMMPLLGGKKQHYDHKKQAYHDVEGWE